MVGAIITHIKRGENQAVVINAILGVMALFVAAGRFGASAF